VRPEFAARREEALSRRTAGDDAGPWLVSLGLTDVGAITGRVVAAILPHLGDRPLDVVLGAGARSLANIQAVAARDSRVRPHIDTHSMAELIASAELAVGAGGSSAWERCTLGLPTVALILADNQRENTAALAMAGASLALEVNGELPDRLAQAVAILAEDRAARLRMSRAAADLCDGLGADRVATRMLAMI
jgi:UDP-2,4-diacetamido-2,4,6-trideoxy-beta-L-altropyranose hydrolase